MQRRTAIKWLVGLLGTCCSLLVAVPGGSFLLSAVRRRGGGGAIVQRVARLVDLVPGEPLQVPVVGKTRDAWTVYDQQIIGRVWLVRRSGSEVPPEKAHVEAFSAVCPHLACTIGLDTERNRFHCPCHEAGFDLAGKRLGAAELGHPNPSPRDMDPLECRVVRDAGDDSWWVEVTYRRFEIGRNVRRPVGAA